ncbi:MAG: hypothetical protein FRX49_04543 [Trebouxia sp. A1-2]|nr:MAG: hypothetical protein FRX49_04543 [Trebouxia sp. A1-2]
MWRFREVKRSRDREVRLSPSMIAREIHSTQPVAPVFQSPMGPVTARELGRLDLPLNLVDLVLLGLWGDNSLEIMTASGAFQQDGNTYADVVERIPEGNLSFSFSMVWVRRGTAQKTPRNAKARDHRTSCPYDSMTGPSGGFWSTVMIPMAGITPTKPARFQRDNVVYHSCQGIRRTYKTFKKRFSLHFILEIRAESSVAQRVGQDSEDTKAQDGRLQAAHGHPASL